MDSVGRNEQIASQIQSGIGDRQELLSELWTNNIGLTQKIIHQATGLQRDIHRQDFEDLEQEAFIGIMSAVQKYDPAAGVKFFTYAESYIRKSIYRYYDRNGQALRVPAYMRKRIKEYTQAQEILKSQGKAVTDENIRSLLSWSDNAMRSVLATVRKMEMQRLDNYLNESDKDAGSVLDMLAGSENVSEDAITGSYAMELHESLRKAMGELPERERIVLQSIYFQGNSIKMISGHMGCTPQNVSRIKREAFKHIRTGKNAEELLAFMPANMIKKGAAMIKQDFKELPEDERNLLL